MLLLRVVIVNEEQRDDPNPLFHRAFIVSGVIKLLKMLTSLWVFHSPAVVRLKLTMTS